MLRVCLSIGVLILLTFAFTGLAMAEAPAKSPGGDEALESPKTSEESIEVEESEGTPTEDKSNKVPDNLKPIFDNYLRKQKEDGTRELGLPQSAFGTDALVNDALQAIGQVVADKSTQAAMEMAKEKLSRLLKCETEADFDQTCKVLDSLKFGTVINSPNVLYNAFLADMATMLSKRYQFMDKSNDLTEAVFTVTNQLIIAGVSSAFGRKDTVDYSLAIQELSRSIAKYADGKTKADKFVDLTSNEQIIILAFAGYFKYAMQSSSSANAPGLYDIVDTLIDGALSKIELKNRLQAKALAMDIYLAISAQKQVGPDNTTRFAKTISVLTTVALLKADDISDPTEKAKMKELIEIVRDLLEGILGGDQNQVVVSCFDFFQWIIQYSGWESIGPAKAFAKADLSGSSTIIPKNTKLKILDDKNKNALKIHYNGVELFIDPSVLQEKFPNSDDYKKALKIVGIIFRYAQTYTGDDPSSAEAKDVRVQVIKDVSDELTDRTDRGGDTVVSLGGSLRAVGGLRSQVDHQSSFYGPISLPLGFGLQHYCLNHNKHGFHMDVGVVDLGQYVSFQEDAEVAEPDWEDALAPSLSLGYFYGTHVPMIVGVTGSYSPHYSFDPDFDPDIDKHDGSWNAGIYFGFYVPLWDFN
jgi:hypothetical protein